MEAVKRLSRWTTELDERLREACERLNHDQEAIAAEMGLSVEAVRHRRQKLKLYMGRAHTGKPTWTPEMDKILIDMRGTYSAAIIAERIGGGITRMAVLSRASRLGLEKIKRNSPKETKRRATKRRPRVKKSDIWIKLDAIQGSEACDLPVDSSPVAKTIYDLIDDRSQCRYPVTTPDGEPQLFCAADVFEGRPYCARHCVACYRRDVAPVQDSSVAYFQRLQRAA